MNIPEFSAIFFFYALRDPKVIAKCSGVNLNITNAER